MALLLAAALRRDDPDPNPGADIDIDYGYGSDGGNGRGLDRDDGSGSGGGSGDGFDAAALRQQQEAQLRRRSSVDATAAFFARPEERRELQRTARRASLDNAVSSRNGYGVEDGGGELLFFERYPAARSANLQHRHRRASMGAVVPPDWNADDDDRHDEFQKRWQQPRRGSAGRVGDLSLHPPPRRRGPRRASTGGAPLQAHDFYHPDPCLDAELGVADYVHHVPHSPHRPRTRRQSQNGGGAGGAWPARHVEATVEAASPVPVRRPSAAVRRASNGGQAPVTVPPPEPQTLRFGINPDVVARMSRRVSGNAAQAASQGLLDDEDEDDADDDEDGPPDYGYGYGYGSDDYGMGYGYAAPSRRRRAPPAPFERRGSHRSTSSSSRSQQPAPAPTKLERRGSHSSQASSGSHRSRRRNSCLIRPEQDPAALHEIALAAQLLVPDSDLESDGESGDDQRLPTKKTRPSPPSDSDGADNSVFHGSHRDAQLNVSAPELYGYGSSVSDASSADENYRQNQRRAGPHSSDEDTFFRPPEGGGNSDSEQSMSSTRRLRRNSCLMRPDGSILGGDTSLTSKHTQLATSESERHLLRGFSDDEEEDYNDPDSLLNRSGYPNKVLNPPHKPSGKLGQFLAKSSNDRYLKDEDDEQSSDEESMLDVLNKAKQKKLVAEQRSATEASLQVKCSVPTDPPHITNQDATATYSESPRVADVSVSPTDTLPELPSPVPGYSSGLEPKGPPPHLLGLRTNAATRARPFTTPHVPLSADNLMLVQRQMAHQRNQPESMFGPRVSSKSRRTAAYNWGDIDFDSDGGDSDDSAMSFGASMYNEIQVFQELDRYNQRPRRRASLDRGMLEMGADGAAHSGASFKPAAGCTCAADYLLRPFCVRLRHGVTVVKHNRSRWSKSAKRVLVLEADGRTLTWRPCEDDPVAATDPTGKGHRRPKLDLLKCRAVRHAREPDPEARKKTGTATIRAKCTKEAVFNKSFSLVFTKRTLDLTAASSDQCRMLMEGLSALCYRLQLEQQQRRSAGDRRGEGDVEDDDADSEPRRRGGGSVTTDTDWASTVYETVSMTHSTVSRALPAAAAAVASGEPPWGL